MSGDGAIDGNEKNPERVERIRAKAEIFRTFDDIAASIPSDADPREYFRTAAPQVEEMIVSRTTTLGQDGARGVRSMLGTIARNLVSKRTEVKRLNGDFGLVLEALRSSHDLRNARMKLDDIAALDATSDPYSIIVTVEEVTFRRIFESAMIPGDGLPSGLHIRGTPISLVRNGIPNPKAVIDHERLHSRLEGISNIVPPNLKLMGDTHSFAAVGDHPRIFRAQDYLEEFHEEIAGAVDSAISANFGLAPRTSTTGEGSIARIDRYEHVTATAGAYIHNLRYQVMQQHNDMNNPDALRMRLLRFFKEVSDEYLSTIGNLERAFRAIEKAPREKQAALVKELQTLAYVIKPREYGDIADYMESVK